MIQCNCPSCGNTYRIPDHLVGKKVSCPQCDFAINAPPPLRSPARSISPVPQQHSPTPLPQAQSPAPVPQTAADDETVLERRVAYAIQLADESCRRLDSIRTAVWLMAVIMIAQLILGCIGWVMLTSGMKHSW
jgi:hypothetical protein